jgi:hypothetical protein
MEEQFQNALHWPVASRVSRRPVRHFHPCPWRRISNRCVNVLRLIGSPILYEMPRTLCATTMRSVPRDAACLDGNLGELTVWGSRWSVTSLVTVASVADSYWLEVRSASMSYYW